MRLAVLFLFSWILVSAQIPLVQLVNLSRPFDSQFQIGDRFEIRITGGPGQPISVRTVRQGRTDWGPVIASTDSSGRWSSAGQFTESDFGAWSEIWTVGGKLATPAIRFSVNAPCMPGGFAQAFQSGPNVRLTCDTAEGRQTFVTPSLRDAFRTPDGRFVPGRPKVQSPEQYHMEILSGLITSAGGDGPRISLSSSRGALGDETAELLSKLIGGNSLTKRETQNALAVIRAAFEKPETIAPGAREPSRMLAFLRRLAERSDDESVKQQITQTIAYVQAR
ncbi:MAG TPA: hypothetical protein VJ732_00615 [Bryobacteraceae bacterium]|nr:hypothetical protein [Bryobacteraceae bacterium]